VRLLPVGLRGDEHIDAHFEAGGLVDDLVATTGLAKPFFDGCHLERVHGSNLRDADGQAQDVVETSRGEAVERNLSPDEPLRPWAHDPSLLQKESGDRVEMRPVHAERLATVKLTDVLPPIRFASGVADIPQNYVELVRHVISNVRIPVAVKFGPYFSSIPNFCRKLDQTEPAEFPMLDQLKREGQTDYLAFVHRFAGESTIGGMDCVYSAWMSAQPDGFVDADLAALRRLVPPLALAIKCASLARIAGTLVEVYLGPDAGRRVLGGRISRGVAERISRRLPRRASRRIEPAPAGPGAEHAPRRRRTAGHARLPGASHRRRLLRQHRERGPPRLHGGRPRRQRGQPHRRDVSLRRSWRAALL